MGSKPCNVEANHDKAMALACRADLILFKKVSNAESRAQSLYRRAFKLEKSVAESFLRRRRYEPTRSILFRSAASLALLVGEKDEAVKLIAAGLDGNPPAEIAAELRELLQPPLSKASPAKAGKR